MLRFGRARDVPTWLRLAVLGLFVVLLLNWFVWFPDEVTRQGGEAISGYVRDGHYFLGSHGDYTEVSQATWQASWVRTALTLAGWVVMAAMMLTGLIYPIRANRGLSSLSRRVAAIEASGPAHLVAEPELRIAGAAIARAEVRFYPEGIEIREDGVAARPLGRREVVSFEADERASVLTVVHTGQDLGSPLTIVAPTDSEVWRACVRSLSLRPMTEGTTPA